MPTLTIVVGLPGAGKSAYCKRYAPGGVYYGDVCHPHKTSGPGGIGEVAISLREGNDCLIEDVSFCEAAQRERVENWIERVVPNVRIEWVFLENDIRKCLCNLLGDFLDGHNRDHLSRFECLFGWYQNPSKKYTIPDGAHVERIVCKYDLIEAVRS